MRAVSTICGLPQRYTRQPTSNFSASVNTNATVATTYYIRGWYTTNGIASIQESAVNGAVSFTIQYKSPASLGLGTYIDTITMEGCYDYRPSRFRRTREEWQMR
jgi:hypothetical protein